MSGNINENRMMYYGEVPWHGLGTKLNKPATAEEAIEAARLDYPIEALDIHYQFGDGKDRSLRTPSNVKAIVRMDNGDYLGVVSDSYKIIQNVEAFDFFDSVVSEKAAIYHTAGALGKGERVWILAKLSDDTIVTKDDVVEKYLLLTNSHDGTSSLKMFFTPIRVVCQNTLIISMRDARDGISIRHMGNIQSKVEEARRVLGLAVNYYARFSQEAHLLLKYQMSKKELEAYFDYALKGDSAGSKVETANFKNERDQLFGLFDNGKGNRLPQVKGSLWAAYNGIAEYTDHYKTIRNLEKDPTNRLKNLWFGTGALIKGRAYQKALEIVGAKKIGG